MFIGHFALGLAAKRVTPRVSLAILFSAAQLADILWPFLLLFGIEQVRIVPGITASTPFDFISYPYSHSLLFLTLWGVVLGFLCSRTVGNGRTFTVIGALVISHWLLDFVTHRPDMPLYPGSPKFGLGLWNSIAGTIVVELVMFAAGVWVYVRATRPRDRIGKWAFWSLIALFLVAYLGNVSATPPSSVITLALTAIGAATLTLLWAWWADRHRETVKLEGT
jgi:LexA-binding, inner membrane-associated putative hydrolase